MHRTAATLAVVMLLIRAGHAVYKPHISRPVRSNRHTIITVSLALLALGYSVLVSTHALAQVPSCADVTGTTVTITTNCNDLSIRGDNSNVTINSGVEISTDTTGAVATPGADDAIIINNGVIQAPTNRAFRTSGGTVLELRNNGTINANGNSAIRNGSTIQLLINEGTISAVDSTIVNRNTATIGKIINTGSITASGNNIGIDNSGTIRILNNSQGASTSALTYDGKLPTNYNIIVTSTSDFGKIVFSNVSGTTNFGVDLSSNLEDVDTTYSTVLSGLSSGDIASGFSGTFGVSGALRKNWTLDNTPGSLSDWDLNVTVIDITANTNTSVTASIKPDLILGINSLTSVTEANFANMNTYDCDLFGINNVCVSLGGRYTTITNPRTHIYSGVLTFGYKLSDNLRVAAFRHDNFSQKTPKSFKLSDKTPLLGALVVWNENANKLGYQLKLANAFQQKYVAVTREVVGSSEEGKGQTVMEAQSYVAELQYAYQLNDDTVIKPYLAVRRALIQQDAYTETNVDSPLSFNQIEDKSITSLLGLKFNWNLSEDIILKGSLGIEHDISHTIDRLEPTGISGLTTVNLDESFNETRPVFSIGFEYNLTPDQRLASTIQYQELPYKSKSESNVYLYYTIGF